MTKENLKKLLDKKIAEGARHFDYNSLGFRKTPEIIIYGRTRDGKHEHRFDVRTLNEEFVSKLIDEIETFYDELGEGGRKVMDQLDLMNEIIKNRPTVRASTEGNTAEDQESWKKGLSKWRPISTPDEVAARKQNYALYREAYCEGLPDFIPSSDRCFHCHKDVFTDYEDNHGHTSCGEKGDRYITGCKHCGQTFCD